MFEVGFTELLLISVLALIVLGPERLPKVAAQVGRWVGRARAMARQFREQLEEEASLEPAPRRPRTETPSADTYTPTDTNTPPHAPAAAAPDVQPPEVVAGTDAERQSDDHSSATAHSPESTPASDGSTPADSTPGDNASLKTEPSATATARAEPPHERGT